METLRSPHKYITQRCCELGKYSHFTLKFVKRRKKEKENKKMVVIRARPIPSYTSHFSNGYASHPFFINFAQHFGITVF